MKTRLIPFSVLLAISPWASAQEPASEEKPMTIAERKESIATLEEHIAKREARLAEWGQDIMSLDHRIESQVAELVKMIAGLKDSNDSNDSNDSRSKVNQLKKHAIEGLQKGIETYAAKRRTIAELVRTGDESALSDLEGFDERILKRIDQIATITKSIPTHKDVKKYESSYTSYWNGYYQENRRITNEWQENRRNTSASNLQRKKTSEMLEEILANLDKKRRDHENSIKHRQLTDAERKLYERELGKYDAYEDHLKKQLREVTTSQTGGGKKVGMNQVMDIIHMVEDERSDLREDVASLFRKYDQFVKGRAYVESLKANLAARRKWMEENAPGE